MTGLMDGACVHVSLQFNYAELNIQGRNVNASSEHEFRKKAACSDVWLF